jgi:hypothetical protein
MTTLLRVNFCSNMLCGLLSAVAVLVPRCGFSCVVTGNVVIADLAIHCRLSSDLKVRLVCIILLVGDA